MQVAALSWARPGLPPICRFAAAAATQSRRGRPALHACVQELPEGSAGGAVCRQAPQGAADAAPLWQYTHAPEEADKHGGIVGAQRAAAAAASAAAAAADKIFDIGIHQHAGPVVRFKSVPLLFASSWFLDMVILTRIWYL